MNIWSWLSILRDRCVKLILYSKIFACARFVHCISFAPSQSMNDHMPLSMIHDPVHEHITRPCIRLGGSKRDTTRPPCCYMIQHAHSCFPRHAQNALLTCLAISLTAQPPRHSNSHATNPTRRHGHSSTPQHSRAPSIAMPRVGHQGFADQPRRLRRTPKRTAPKALFAPTLRLLVCKHTNNTRPLLRSMMPRKSHSTP